MSVLLDNHDERGRAEAAISHISSVVGEPVLSMVNPPHSNMSDKFSVVLLCKSKKLVKVYEKSRLLRDPEYLDQGYDDRHKQEQFLHRMESLGKLHTEYVFPFLRTKMNSYSFLPDFVFETDLYFGVEFFDTKDWTESQTDDWVHMNSPYSLYHALRLQDSYLPSEKSDIDYGPKYTMTEFFDSVVKQFKEFYANEEVTLSQNATEHWSDVSAHLVEDSPYINDIWDLTKLCISMTAISRNDFVVKRDDDDNIVDWKYTDIENLTVLPPNHIYYISEPIPGGLSKHSYATDPDYYDLLADGTEALKTGDKSYWQHLSTHAPDRSGKYDTIGYHTGTEWIIEDL